MTGEGYEVIQLLDCHGAKAPRNDGTRHAGPDPASQKLCDYAIADHASLVRNDESLLRGSEASHPELDSGSINANETDRSRVKHGMTNILFAKQTELGSSRFTPHSSHKCAAFTLAEVLITLGIIGIVAAITMPSLLAKHNERQTVVRLKHTYSILSQAVAGMVAEHGNLDTWADDSKEFFEQELKKQLKVIGEQGYIPGLFSYMPNVNHKYVLNNGVVVGVAGRNINNGDGGHYCRTSMRDALNGTGSIHYGSCASVLVDINGRSKPNAAGRDTFEFRVYTDGVLPKGHIEANSNDGFSQCFSNSVQDNHNCTAWVIYHENMDYLRCRDKLHYDHGPYSCKEAAENNP